MIDIRPTKYGCYHHEIYIFHLRTPVARTEHTCHACQEPIIRGEKYARFTTRDQEGPGFEDWTVHGECYLAGGAMFYSERPAERWGS